MSCGHCVTAVEAALTGVAGVASADVTIGRAVLTTAEASGADVADDAIRAIERAGYSAAVA
jgi:copper chaperone CopZ